MPCHQNCRGQKRKNDEVDSSSSENDSEDDSDNDSTFGSDYDPGDPGGAQAEPPEPDNAPNGGGDPGGARKAQYKLNSRGKEALYFENFLFVKAKPKIGPNKEVIGQIWRCEKMHTKNCRARVHILSDDTIVTKAEDVHHSHLGDPLRPIINKVGLYFLKGVSY